MSILLLDYQMARDDDRAANSILATMISVAIALLAAIVAVSVSDEYEAIPDAAIAVAPLLPLGTISYIITVSATVILRSFYMRALEAELRDLNVKELTKLPGVKPPSGTELTIGMVSGSRGRPIFRLIYATILVAVLLVFGGVTVLLARDVSLNYQIAMFLVYSPIGFLLFAEGIYINAAGRSLFRSVLREFLKDSYRSVSRIVDSPLSNVPRERSLMSYLVFPRPEDITKWAFIPASSLIGYLLPLNTEGTSDNVLYAVLTGWLAFEYLTYQARYQINDIRGIADDLRHPATLERKRLPIHRNGVSMSIVASLAVAAIRVVGIVAIVLVSPFGIGPIVGWASAAAAASMIAYEFLRTFSLAGSVGARANAILIWITVGAGYSIRVCIGLALVGLSASTHWYVYLFFGLAAWAFGVMFVTFTWVLEAVSHLHKESSSTYGYEVTDGSASLGDKLHLKELLPYIGISPVALAGRANGPSCRGLEPLARGRGCVAAPWNVALVISCFFGVLACIAGGVEPDKFGTREVLLGLGVTTGSIFLLLASSTFARIALLLAVVSCAGLVAVPRSLGFAATIVLSIAIFWGMYVLFRASSYEKLKSFNQNLAQSARAAAVMLVRAVLGSRTFDLLSRSRKVRAEDELKRGVEVGDYQRFSP